MWSYIWCHSLWRYIRNLHCYSFECQRTSSWNYRKEYFKRGIIIFFYLPLIFKLSRRLMILYTVLISILFHWFSEGTGMEHFQKRTFGTCRSWNSYWRWNWAGNCSIFQSCMMIKLLDFMAVLLMFWNSY